MQQTDTHHTGGSEQTEGSRSPGEPEQTEGSDETGEADRVGGPTETAESWPTPPAPGAEPRSLPRDGPVLEVSPWWDPALALDGHNPLDQYAEIYWLPILGPAALLALRYCARGLEARPDGFAVTHSEFARSLGLGNRRGANAPAVRCLDRLAYFGHARVDSTDSNGTRIVVRTHVPDLPRHLRKRLPGSLRAQEASGQHASS